MTNTVALCTQNAVLDGHALSLKLSTKQLSTTKEKSRRHSKSGGQSTKILIKNIPFEASKKDVRDLFRYMLIQG